MGMPVIPTSDQSFENALADVVESIALEEAALSTLMNANGEAIQELAAIEPPVADDIIGLNESINNLLGRIAKLQILLQFKLEVAGSLNTQ